MSQTAVLVWLSASSVLPTFRADLDSFAQSRLLRFEAPRENGAAFRTSAYAPDAVAQVESALEEARNESASLEQSRALGALERAERVLREHPELPQSAWLMAEILELSADVESSAPDGADAALALRKRAAVLAGPRATPFSDRPAPLGSEPEGEQLVSVSGLEDDDALEWDGRQSLGSVSTSVGAHHVRVARAARLLWAGWVSVGPGDAQLRLPIPETVPCSPDDVGQGRFVGGHAKPAPHARCDSYVLARARVGGGIEASLCERETCGNVVIWEHPFAKRATASDEKRRFWPYALAASGAALAITGIALWRAGVFDRPAASTSEGWVFDGQKPAGFRF